MTLPTVIQRCCTLLILLALFPHAPLYAEVFRVVDEAGNVTYTDQPPGDKIDANVEKIPEKDQLENISESPQTVEKNQPGWLKEVQQQKDLEADQQRRQKRVEKQAQLKAWQQELANAKQAVKQAERALEVGKEPGEGDFVGIVGGGARPSSDYLQRLERLEKTLKDAKRDLKLVKRSKP